MARIQIKGPDGQAYEFEAPDDATPQQIEDMAREVSGHSKDYPVVHDAPKPEQPPPSAGEQFADNLKNDVAGIAQGAAALPDMAATAVGKVASVVPTAIGYGLDALGYTGAADTAHKVAHGLANPYQIGDAVETVAPTPDTTFGKANRFAGQMVGGAATMPSSAVENVVARFAGEVPKGFVPASKTAEKVAGTIVDDAKQAKIPVMTSDVAPPKTFIGKSTQAVGERIPLTGTGGAREAQQAKRVDAVKAIANEFGAGEMSAPALADVTKDLAARRGAELTRLTNQKNAVIDNLQGAVPVPLAVQAIDKQIANLQILKAKEVQPVITKLANWRDALTGKTNIVDTGVLDANGSPITREVADVRSLRTIEDLRKIMGEAFNDPGLAGVKSVGEKAVNAIYGPLREDMGAFIKATGKPGEFDKWKSANDALSSMAGDLKSTAMKKALRNAETTPEDVASMLFSQKPSDVRRLYSALSPAGRSKAQSAILQRAVEKAGGLESISPDRFATQVKNLGKSVGVFFQGDDLARIEGLTRVLKTTQRAAQAGFAPPTGVQAVPYAMGAGFTTLFGIPGGISAALATGLLARAYESPPVRNLLLKLARTPAGSQQEAALLKRASAAIAAAAQGANRGSINGLNDNFVRMGSAAASPDQGPEQQ